MRRAVVKPDPRGRDALEPPGVAAGRLLSLLILVIAVAALSAAALWGAFRWRTGRPPPPHADPFPAPRLEINQTPRRSAGESHGPGPYRLAPPEARVGDTAPPDAGLEQAMRAEAARGAAAYDPLPATRPGP